MTLMKSSCFNACQLPQLMLKAVSRFNDRFNPIRDVAQPGSAPALGAGGRRFKSSRPDQAPVRGFVVFTKPLVFYWEHLLGAL